MDNHQRYFDEIRSAWKPFSSTHKIIPFCTPLVQSPTAMVIGMNHSDFVPNGGTESERIATAFSDRLPTENTFLDHEHKFSRGLKAVCERAEIVLDNGWVGTNRCAVQTGPNGLGEVFAIPEYDKCQAEMDLILKEMVRDLKPKNVILVGKFAAGLYYDRAQKLTFDDLTPRDEILDGAISARLIPVKHLSWATYWKMGADRLRQHFIAENAG